MKRVVHTDGITICGLGSSKVASPHRKISSSSSKCRFLRIGIENHRSSSFPIIIWYDSTSLRYVKFLCCVVCSWKSMAEHLPGRATNAIKNRWNSHLKKRNETVSAVRRKVLYAEELLFDDEASELSVRRYDPEPLMAEVASLIPNVDPNEMSEAEIDAWISSLIINDGQNPSSSIPEHTSWRECPLYIYIYICVCVCCQIKHHLLHAAYNKAVCNESPKYSAKYMSECPLYIYIYVCVCCQIKHHLLHGAYNKAVCNESLKYMSECPIYIYVCVCCQNIKHHLLHVAYNKVVCIVLCWGFCWLTSKYFSFLFISHIILCGSHRRYLRPSHRCNHAPLLPHRATRVQGVVRDLYFIIIMYLFIVRKVIFLIPPLFSSPFLLRHLLHFFRILPVGLKLNHPQIQFELKE